MSPVVLKKYICADMGELGWGGGLAEHIVLPKSCVIPIPDSISLEVGGMSDPSVPSFPNQ